MVRYAFTMIELIFALVIMGITFISLPLIIVNDSTSVERNLMQEAVFASATKLGQILSYRWDENSVDPDPALEATDVVNTGGDPELNRNADDFRIGHFVQPLHRRMTPNGIQRAATAIGPDGGDLDDIDDFNAAGTSDLIAATSQRGYKKNYRITTTVSYVSDAAAYANSVIAFAFGTGALAGGTSNLKMVQIDTDQQNAAGAWTPILTLRSYSANIGETDFYMRTY